ncbi:Asp-tRNA(Asn)/Glu-tRNA(Gln) amidotransferase subunit GatC [Desulfosediminicola flagellatus]|uniref:Asp-tRNA(Asn)/Glu-tRNA(Gln) amidotransferase subunit GatC n=1 Tax=Desulfosediminicola flagellatus TaxID=2569541 RepID=UPI0010AC00C6|nr:Asp-tRNA(Asn)/Glu-tRNA(Gln) amidotransferase subunit GatC [Desulfosediminicola flagellatus]
MKITREEVLHVAHLARLNLNEDELVKMTEQLDNILSYVDKLSELNTENVEPTTHAHKSVNAFREDVVLESLSREDSLANAPEDNGEMFTVPRII